jgi:hypothetical protein
MEALRELTWLLHVANSTVAFVAFDCLVLRATTATPGSHQAEERSYEIVQRRYWLEPHPDRDGRD